MRQTYLYPIIIEACGEGGFFAKCPSIQGAHAQGETYAETLENLESVIKVMLGDEKEKEKNQAFKVTQPMPAFQVTLPITQ